MSTHEPPLVARQPGGRRPAAARANGRSRRWLAHGVAAALLAAATELAAAPPLPSAREPPEAREQARLCELLNLEEGAAACRAALSLGIGPARRGAVRQILARHLVALEKWDELAALLREDVRLDPTNAQAWGRLGAVLLFGLDQRAEALRALTEAVRLAPSDAANRLTLGLALAADDKAGEAAAAIHEAMRLDPGILDDRPAARAVLDAVEAGRSWP